MSSFNVIGFATVLAALGAAGIYFLKRAGDALKGVLAAPLEPLLVLGTLLANRDLWIGTSLYALAFLWLMAVISRAPLSQFFPLAVGINIVLTCAAGVILLGESVSPIRLLGIALILCGVVVASR